MRRIAVYTLGCKVNQYDTEAMLEQFERTGYQPVPFDAEADVYLINTCTVTGTGDQKSLKAIRRVARQHPQAAIIVAGCLAQRDAARIGQFPGVRLVLGTQRRAEAAQLLECALNENRVISAVGELKGIPFEYLTVDRHEAHTRAIMKIQEGCDRYCAYCIIPSVRGPVRSMPLSDVSTEAERLADAGYQELILTGIHLASYGRDLGASLLDAIGSVHAVQGVRRIRLGSLEPLIADEDFVGALAGMPKLCHHFHLSLQSGSDSVLRRMRRRYTAGEYMAALERILRAMPDAAITTDILCGFPGETDQEAQETISFVEQAAFSRIHVFPYSRRAGTAADLMPDQVPEPIKQMRAADLIALGNKLEANFAKALLGSVQQVLFEELVDGAAEGYTGQYVRVRAGGRPGEIAPVRLIDLMGGLVIGRVEE